MTGTGSAAAPLQRRPASSPSPWGDAQRREQDPRLAMHAESARYVLNAGPGRGARNRQLPWVLSYSISACANHIQGASRRPTQALACTHQLPCCPLRTRRDGDCPRLLHAAHLPARRPRRRAALRSMTRLPQGPVRRVSGSEGERRRFGSGARPGVRAGCERRPAVRAFRRLR